MAEEELDLRYVFLDKAGENDLQALLQQLPTSERERALTYRRFEDQLAFAIGRVLVRTMLSEYAPEPPGGWQFGQNAFGKPLLANAAGVPDLRFNLSHCAGLVAVGLSIGREIGVDAECIDSNIDYLDITRGKLAASEYEYLRSLPKEQQQECFFSLWTLKEAYAKATGKGLSLSLSQFSFSLNPPVISFAADAAEEPSSWFFWQDRPAPLHVVAVAAQQRSPAENLRCRVSRVELAELTSPSNL